MKAVADTLGVARSNLYDRLKGETVRAVAIISPVTSSCCRGSSDWSPPARLMATGGSLRS